MIRKFVAIAVVAAGLVLPAAAQAQFNGPTVVPILVVKAKDGETGAFARVVIHGRVFLFLIDTGAMMTLVDPALAQQAHLKTVGNSSAYCGVTGCSRARRVRLRNWSIGGRSLPNVVVASGPITGLGGRAFGLLGSDVLSRFGMISLDYQHGELVLGD